MTTLSLAPYAWWPLGVLSCYLLLWLLKQVHSGAGAAWIGWFYGAGLFGSGASWVYVSIHTYGNAPTFLAVILTTLFCGGLALLSALSAWLFYRFLRQAGLMSYLGFASLWVIFEWLRSWLLTGFPWLYIGYAHIDTWLSGWVPITGIFGISFLCAVTGAAILGYQIERSRPCLAALGLTLACWPLGWYLSTQTWVQQADAPPVSVVMIQANISQELKWLPEYYQPTLDLYATMTEPELGADIIIWPEAAIPNYFHRASGFLDPMSQQAADTDSALLTGIPHLSSDGTGYHNSIVGLGKASGRYHKQRLVPFGEYVPLESWLRGLIAFFDLPMSHFSQGPADQALLKVDTMLVAPFICYEIVYPELVRQQSAQADLLVTISNDSWFGQSIGPLQHLQMARMRALENGRYLLRGTNNGVSAIIDAKGAIIQQSPQFEATILRGEAFRMSGQTPFSRWGNWPTLITCFLMLAIGHRHHQRCADDS